MKSLVDILEDYLLISQIIEQVWYLRDQLVDVKCGDIIVRQRYSNYILSCADLNASHLGCTFVCCSPFPWKLQRLFSLVAIILFPRPQAEFAVVAAQNEPFRKGADGSNGQAIKFRLIKHVVILLTYFKAVLASLFQHEDFTLVSGSNDHFLLIPSVSSNASTFGNSADILERLESVLLNSQESNRTPTTYTNEVAIAGTNC